MHTTTAIYITTAWKLPNWLWHSIRTVKVLHLVHVYINVHMPSPPHCRCTLYQLWRHDKATVVGAVM